MGERTNEGPSVPGDRPPEADSGTPATDANTAWSVLSLLISGMLVWGGIGWLIDRWAKTGFFFPFFLLVGCAGALYLVIRRFGNSGERPEQDKTERQH